MRRNIPLFKVFKPHNVDEILNPLRSVLESGWVAEGPQVGRFEQMLGKFIGATNVSAVNSCTSALQLSLRLAGVRANDQVITTPMTCMATNEPILLCGAEPVWADIDPNTGNIDPKSIKEKITTRTKAIMVVHWGGYPCDLDEVNAIAQVNNLKVIEDCAHALGARYKDKVIGSYSNYCCFSFQAIKHIHTGDGGAIVCKNVEDHLRARRLRWFGIDRENRRENEYGIAEWNVTEPGYKYHMNDIAATIGIAHLPYAEEVIRKRTDNASYYKNELADLSRLRLLQEKPDRQSSYWLFTARVDDQMGFIRYMKENGIGCSIVHARNDKNSVFANYNNSALSGVDEFCKEMVCIPVGEWVMEDDRKYICEVIKKEKW